MTPYIGADGADAGPGRRVGDERDRHRPRPTAPSYTFKVTATNAVGTSAAVGRLERGDPAGDDLRLRHAGHRRLAATRGAVELGVKFQTDFAGAVTGIRFYKAAANTGTHVGSLWTSGGTRLAQRHVHQRDRRPAGSTVTFSTPGGDHGRHHLRRVLLRAQRPLLGHRRRLRLRRVDNAPLHALANGTSAQRRLRVRRGERASRRNTFGAGNYWVDVLFDPAAAPGQVTSVTATAGQASATVSWTAPSSGGPVTSYDVTPYIGSTAQTPNDRHRHPAGDEHDDHRADRRARPTRSRCARPTRRHRARRRPPSNAVTPLGAGTPGAPTGVTAQARLEVGDRELDGAVETAAARSPSYTVTPYVGATAQDAGHVDAPATSARITGLTNGTGYTFRVAATNGAGTGPASAATTAVTPRASIFELGGARDRRRGRHELGRAWASSSADVAGSITGLRFYKASDNTGTHVASLWSSTGTLLARGHRSATRPPPAGRPSRSPRRCRSPRARPTWPATWRPTGTTRSRRQRSPRRDRQPAAAARWRTPQSPTASTATARRPLPDQRLQLHQLRGRRPVRPGP